MFNINELFEEVRSSINSADTTDAIWKEKLKFEAGKDYVVRLIPFVKEGREGFKKSLYHYIRYSWQDPAGKWVNVISPRTWNEQCPIVDYSKRVKFKGSKAEQDEMKERLSYREGAYANVYVIKDPTNPENEGKVKILDMGKKLYDIIKSALDGELDKSWTEQARKYSPDKSIEVNVGKKVYDLSPDGVNLTIHVRKNQFGLNSYDTSEFTLSDTDLGKTDSELQEIYQACHDLSQIEPTRNFDELSDLFKRTYLNVDSTPVVTSVIPGPAKVEDIPALKKAEPAEDAIPMFSKPTGEVDTEKMVDDDWFKKYGIDPNNI
jgi:hypothetical protein